MEHDAEKFDGHLIIINKVLLGQNCLLRVSFLHLKTYLVESQYRITANSPKYLVFINLGLRTNILT